MRSVEDDHNLEDAIRVVLIGERNHEDSARKATSVVNGMRRRKVERGLHNGCRHEKLGYRNARHEDGTIKKETPRELDPPAARLIRRIFDDALAAISQRQIAADLAREGIPTPNGGEWRQATVRGILYDPYYAGYFRESTRHKTPKPGEPLIEGKHPAIVTLDEYWRVLEISQRRRTNGDGQGGRKTTRPALFTNGHLRCGFCGGPMGPRFKPGRQTPWERYTCLTHERDKDRCPMVPVDLNAVEDMMLMVVKEQPGTLVAHIEEAIESMVRARVVTNDRLVEAEHELANLTAKRSKVEGDYLAGDLPAHLYGELREKLDTEADAARAQVEQLRSRATELASTLSTDQMEEAVASVMDRIREVVSDTARIETTRNIIRQAWPAITLHRVGANVELALGDVSPGFTRALDSITDCNGLPLLSVVETVHN
jgi:hypothetical protein